MIFLITKTQYINTKFLQISTGVRYWNDGIINGYNDTDTNSSDDIPHMPCVTPSKKNVSQRNEAWRWEPKIDIDKGIIVNWVTGVTAELNYKVCDDFNCEILDEKGNIVTEYSGYVPQIMCPAEPGYGDYIIMKISATGKIEGWNNSLIKEIIAKAK